MRYTFVGTDLIDKNNGLIHRFHSAKKHPAPVLEAETPLELDGYGIGAPSVLFANGRFRMWYMNTYPFQDFVGNPDVVGYAESEDGIYWHRPNVGLLALNSSKDNNLVSLFGLCPSVFKGPQGSAYEDKLLAISMPTHGTHADMRLSGKLGLSQQVTTSPNYRDVDLHGRRDRLYYESVPKDFFAGERPADPWGGWMAWVSDDGYAWKPIQNECVIPGMPDSGSFIYDPYRRQFIGTPKMEPHMGDRLRRCISSTIAQEITDWKWPRLSIVPNEVDDEMARRRGFDAVEFYCMALHPRPDVIIGIPSVFYTTGPLTGDAVPVAMHGIIEPQVCYSYDGLQWHHAPGRRALIPLGEHGDWDGGMILPQSIVEVGDEVFIYYTADANQHGWANRWEHLHSDWHGRRVRGEQRIGLATLKRDRFASMSGYQEGWVQMKPAPPQGCNLAINARTAKGYVAVEVRDAEGGVIDGFSRDDCVPFTGDALAAPIRWRNGTLSDLPAQTPVRLRFYVWDADLFAYELQATQGTSQ